MMMNYRKFSLSAIALAVAGVLAIAPACAEEPADAGAKPAPKVVSKEARIPDCLASLKLSQHQQDQIKEIVREYDADILAVWMQFGERYRETIRTEAMLLTAIEDNLTDQQRTKVRDQRRKTARHQKALAGTDTKPNQSTAKSESAVEEEIAIVGVMLTHEQQMAADKLQEKCLSQLRSLNRDIQGLHIRLVSLEADKLAEIESVLTKEQLLQLREIRQNAPIASAVASDRTGRPTTSN